MLFINYYFNINNYSINQKLIYDTQLHLLKIKYDGGDLR